MYLKCYNLQEENELMNQENTGAIEINLEEIKVKMEEITTEQQPARKISIINRIILPYQTKSYYYV